jgi:hypothetical protein
MLATARDIAAISFLEKRLGILREEFLAQAIAGADQGPEYWVEGERAVMAELKSRFYNTEARQMLEPDEAAHLSDEEDFERRTQKLAEHAILMTHHILTGIPWVGAPGNQDT